MVDIRNAQNFKTADLRKSIQNNMSCTYTYYGCEKIFFISSK